MEVSEILSAEQSLTLNKSQKEDAPSTQLSSKQSIPISEGKRQSLLRLWWTLNVPLPSTEPYMLSLSGRTFFISLYDFIVVFS